MVNELPYSSTLTGASFLFYELKQVVLLKNQGLPDDEILKKVVIENLFQYSAKSSVKRSFPSILRRVNSLEQSLRDRIIQETIEVGKQINLYVIMKTDRLFNEFMNEVVREKLNSGSNFIEKKDLNLFFSNKSEQHPVIAAWSVKNVTKLKQVYMKILNESGVLKDKITGQLNPFQFEESGIPGWPT